jgi:hypothetical protein
MTDVLVTPNGALCFAAHDGRSRRFDRLTPQEAVAGIRVEVASVEGINNVRASYHIDDVPQSFAGNGHSAGVEGLRDNLPVN